jgi:molybdopterin-guanine dinucleotide biosynthesis protein A
VLGILLAGGRGERLGLGSPKALVRLGGRTLLERALGTLRSCCDEVVVCAPASLALPVDPAIRVDDPLPGGGPLPALVAGLRSRTFERAVALGVDLPFVGLDALAVVSASPMGALAVVPAPGGRPQPLAAAYAPGAVAPLAAAVERGERALVRAVLALPARIIEDAELVSWLGSSDEWFNLNTPDDLDFAERLIVSGLAR